MKKKILIIQIIQTIFIGVMFTIAKLQENGILFREGRSTIFYVVAALIYWVIITIPICFIMKNNQEKEKKFLIGFIIISIEILLIALYCGSVDCKVDRMNFEKNSEITIATVYNVEKDSNWYSGSSDNSHKYTYHVTLKYYFDYSVNNIGYNSIYSNSKSGSSNSKSYAEQKANQIKQLYKEGDTFTIYYNKNNPEDWRKDLEYPAEGRIKSYLVVVIALRVFCIGTAIMDSAKEKKEEKN